MSEAEEAALVARGATRSTGLLICLSVPSTEIIFPLVVDSTGFRVGLMSWNLSHESGTVKGSWCP